MNPTSEEQRQRQRAAAEARRLLNEPLLAEAFEAVKLDAMVRLTTIDPTNMAGILREQAIANCLQEVLERLEAKITAAGDRDGGISVETDRPN